jgi:lipid A disaccharide synthetase
VALRNGLISRRLTEGVGCTLIGSRLKQKSHTRTKAAATTSGKKQHQTILVETATTTRRSNIKRHQQQQQQQQQQFQQQEEEHYFLKNSALPINIPTSLQINSPNQP